MKTRLLKRTILSLILGSITTIAVAVAWGCSILITREIISWGQSHTVVLPTSDPRHWEAVAWIRSAVSTHVMACCYDGNKRITPLDERIERGIEKGAIWSDLPADVRSIYHHSDGTRGDFAWGWPIVALSFCIDLSGRASVDSGLKISTENYDYTFPLKPVWAGIAIDSIIFALPWFAILLIITKAHHYRRQRKNQCPSCGYSLHLLQTPRCPECGNLCLPHSQK